MYEIDLSGNCTCGKEDCASPGKHPRTINGFKDATRDKQQINKWWRENPLSNIGVRTGESTGIVVLDIDTRHGGCESLSKLSEKLGEELPTTGIVNTGGGGAHFYFKHPGFTVRSRSPGFGAEYPGLDIKGDGGYAIAPPSNHVSGNKYTWEHEDELAEIPDRLLALIKEEEHRPAPITVEVSGISERRRHNSLLAFAAAYHRQGWTEKPLDKNCWLTMKLSATHHWVKER